MDSLAGLRRLHASLGPEYALVVSDTTGASPGDRGLRERLAFLYRWTRVERDILASDITYDRSHVVRNLYDNRQEWTRFFEEFDRDVAKASTEGNDPPSFSDRIHPAFSVFIRTPHCAAFNILGRSSAKDINFIAVNAHMLYGQSSPRDEARMERRREFEALLDWLVERAKARDRIFYRNIILMGDLNMDFQDSNNPRSLVDDRLRALNNGRLSDAAAGSVNFPFLSNHPNGDGQLFKTSARDTETYDHIAFFIDRQEQRLPSVPENKIAGSTGPDGYNYGVFRFIDLFAEAIHERPFSALATNDQKDIYDRCKADVSDHMPAWVRLPMPGA